ncbi:hypothetical protein RDI58_013322 [Solanum bulbocastanum]|uniref:Uncharacterized protein n=1 Tax=Solanum bulbocastanum TaxID=147425 RepID=A0AAN8YEJ1_SOLBU
MYRAASSRLRALKLHESNRVLARFLCSTAVATKPSGGLFSWSVLEFSSSHRSHSEQVEQHCIGRVCS